MFDGNEKHAKCLLKFAKNVEDERYEMTLRTSIRVLGIICLFLAIG